jgi:hypothetical protein
MLVAVPSGQVAVTVARPPRAGTVSTAAEELCRSPRIDREGRSRR